MPRIAPATRSASSVVDGELDAAGLAAAADEDLGLDDDRRGAAGEDPLGRGACLRDGVGDLPGGDRQALGDEQRLGVGFLDLHARQGSVAGVGAGDRWYRVAAGAPDDSGTNRDGRLAILVSAARWAAPPPRGVMQRDLVERARRGDHDAFAELAGAAISRLDATAWLILRDPDQAKDAVQNALVRAWRDLPTLRDPDRFDAWLHRLRRQRLHRRGATAPPAAASMST